MVGSVGSVQLIQPKLEVTRVSGSFVSVRYTLLPGNRPMTYGNYFAVWQSAYPQVPWDSDLVGRAAPSHDQSQGSLPIRADLQAKSYIVGLALGENPSSVCATVFIPAMGDELIEGPPAEQEFFATTLALAELQSDHAIIRYALPKGSTPQSFGHWVGLWEGERITYDGSGLRLRNGVERQAAEGEVALVYSFRATTTYTVAYFTAGGDCLSAAACLLTFRPG